MTYLDIIFTQKATQPISFIMVSNFIHVAYK